MPARPLSIASAVCLLANAPEALSQTLPQFRVSLPSVSAYPSLPEAQPARVVAAPAFRTDLPRVLQRRPFRNFAGPSDYPPFTLRTTVSSDVQVTLSLGVQTELRYSDNINSAPSGQAIADTIIDVTPILQLNVGDRPGPRRMPWRETEYYLEVLYAPTQHWLLDQQSSDFLHRVVGEVGRATPKSRLALHLEYDENLFSSASDTSPEEAFTIFELSPIVEYSITPITSLRSRGTYRRITLEQGLANRTDRTLDLGFDTETSVKTTIGAGAEFGHLDYDRSDFGEQKYQQFYLSWLWKATPKVTFRTRSGVELRQFDRPAAPKEDRVSPVIIAAVSWQAAERTRLDIGFRVRNQPSIIQRGAVFQEVRFGFDLTHELPHNFYLRSEFELINRNYDSGRDEREWTLRPAVGYRTTYSALVDSANVELFYQYRRRTGNSADLEYDRNQVGIQSTIYF